MGRIAPLKTESGGERKHFLRQNLARECSFAACPCKVLMYSFFVTRQSKVSSSLAKHEQMYYTLFMKLSSYAKRIGISYHTAWRMWKHGQIPGYHLPTGTVIIDPPELRSTPV